MKKVSDLEAKIAQKDAKIEALECRLDELEQYSKKNNVIVSGLNVPVASYADAVSRPLGDASSDEEVQIRTRPSVYQRMKADFIGILKEKMLVDVAEHEISAIHELPSRSPTQGKRVLVKFANSETKRSVMTSRRNLQSTNIFINDHMTPQNANIFKRARDLKRQGKLFAAWTLNGRVFVKNYERTIPKEIKNVNDLPN